MVVLRYVSHAARSLCRTPVTPPGRLGGKPFQACPLGSVNACSLSPNVIAVIVVLSTAPRFRRYGEGSLRSRVTKLFRASSSPLAARLYIGLKVEGVAPTARAS